MKKIFTIFIGIFVCMANIGFAMDVIDIPLSNEVGPGGFKVKYNNTLRIFNQRVNTKAISDRFLIVRDVGDSNTHLFLTKDEKMSILLTASQDGYIKEALLSVPYDNKNAGNDLYTLTLMMIFTLDLFDESYELTTESALNNINFNSTKYQFQTYVLDLNRFNKGLTVESICMTKKYLTLDNTLTIFMSKTLVSNYK